MRPTKFSRFKGFSCALSEVLYVAAGRRISRQERSKALTWPTGHQNRYSIADRTTSYVSLIETD